MHWHIYNQDFDRIERFAVSVAGRERAYILLKDLRIRLMMLNPQDLSLKRIFCIIRNLGKSV